MREGWLAERPLHTLLGDEVAEREMRRLVRARADSQLPLGKSMAVLDFDLLDFFEPIVPIKRLGKGRVMLLLELVGGSRRSSWARSGGCSA